MCGVLAADNVERVDGYVENVTANSLGLVSFLSIDATKFQDNLNRCLVKNDLMTFQIPYPLQLKV